MQLEAMLRVRLRLRLHRSQTGHHTLQNVTVRGTNHVEVVDHHQTHTLRSNSLSVPTCNSFR